MEADAARYIGAGLALIAMFGVGIGLGNIFSNFLQATARNPAAHGQLQQIAIFGFAVTEAIALFALVVALLILFA
jgi:F-type H+-transporting ATPase subunit c